MSARSFRSVFTVATCAGAALTCYLVSLNVASERAALEDTENRIVLAQRDIRLLQTEIGTRGRLAQLERWNVKVLALSAPSADQFLEGGFQLARLARPQEKLDVEAPVVLASAPAPQPTSPQLVSDVAAAESGAGANVTAARLMRQASLKVTVRQEEPVPAARQPEPRPLKTVESKLAVEKKHVAKPVEAAKAPPKKAGDKKVEAAAKPVTKPVRTAKIDPLAPLPAKANPRKTARESGTP